MKYKTYRICLLSLVILALIGGIFYYYNMEESHAQTLDGTFVEAMPEETMDAFCRNVAAWVNEPHGGIYEY